MIKVGIINYGLGNIRSVAGAIERVGGEAVISSDTHELSECTCLILPGVGAFGDGMSNLHSRGLVSFLNDEVLNKQKPILGICLGAQLLATESFEFGHHQGLNWINASVKKIVSQDPEVRIPHVGWNYLHQENPSVLFKGIPDDALFYYVHSFHIEVKDKAECMGTCTHGHPFCSVVERGNIFGTQFHPEKSQTHGLVLLKNFIEHANG